MQAEFHYEELLARDNVRLDIFWLKDESLEDSANLPLPMYWQTALAQFEGIAEELGEEE